MIPPATHHFTDTAGDLGRPNQRAERGRFGQREAAFLQQGPQMHGHDGHVQTGQHLIATMVR